jgi:hypothetical protein
LFDHLGKFREETKKDGEPSLMIPRQKGSEPFRDVRVDIDDSDYLTTIHQIYDTKGDFESG